VPWQLPQLDELAHAIDVFAGTDPLMTETPLLWQ
jgi:hypothetical protein